MSRFTIQDFIASAKEAAGEDGVTELDESIIDRSLSDLGFDSLSIVATLAYVEKAHSVRVEDDFDSETVTPREIIARVNEALIAE